MRQTGIKYTCDRCGLEHFVDFDKIDVDTRQYYESSREARPQNWSYVHGCYLCPDCGRIYRENFWKFIERRRMDVTELNWDNLGPDGGPYPYKPYNSFEEFMAETRHQPGYVRNMLYKAYLTGYQHGVAYGQEHSW